MFVKKKNDISRYEFLVLITMLLVLIGMIKPFWSSFYVEKLQRLSISTHVAEVKESNLASEKICQYAGLSLHSQNNSILYFQNF